MAKYDYESLRAEEKAVAQIQAMALRLLRKNQMKRKDLAKIMRVSESHVSQLLSDKPKNLTIKAAARLFHALGEELQFSCEGIQQMDKQAAIAKRKKIEPTGHLYAAGNWNSSSDGFKKPLPADDDELVAA